MWRSNVERHRIEITNTVEHEDGSCTMTIDMDEDVQKIMVGYGIKFALACAAYNITVDEAYDRLAASATK